MNQTITQMQRQVSEDLEQMEILVSREEMTDEQIIYLQELRDLREEVDRRKQIRLQLRDQMLEILSLDYFVEYDIHAIEQIFDLLQRITQVTSIFFLI